MRLLRWAGATWRRRAGGEEKPSDAGGEAKEGAAEGEGGGEGGEGAGGEKGGSDSESEDEKGNDDDEEVRVAPPRPQRAFGFIPSSVERPCVNHRLYSLPPQTRTHTALID